MLKRSIQVLLALCALGAIYAPGAFATAPGVGYEAFGIVDPTVLAPGGYGLLYVNVFDTGAVNGKDATVVDELPAGLEAVEEVPGHTPASYAAGLNKLSEGCSGTTTVICQLANVNTAATEHGASDEIANYPLQIPVRVAADASVGSRQPDLVTVTGAGALYPAKARVPVAIGTGTAPHGIANADAWITNADGSVDTQAGSHPYEFSLVLAPNVEGAGPSNETPSGGQPRALDVNLPPGLVGEPGAVPQCSRVDFDRNGDNGSECPPASQIGLDEAAPSGDHPGITMPIFNLVPPPGVAAEFGLDFNGTSTFLDARVRSGGDYGITEHANFPQQKVTYNMAMIWGYPGEHTFPGESRAELEGSGLRPFLTMPTSCKPASEAPQFSIEELGTWLEPEATAPPARFSLHNSEGEPVGITGCEKLEHFEPSVNLAPDTTFSDTPAGLTATVKVPQGLNPEGLASPGLKETTVTLPEGVAINPGQATGLAACQPSEEDIGGETEAYDGPPECPAASKVGTDEITTPLLPKPLKGNVYVLQSNPPNLQLLVAASYQGVNLKLIGNVHLDEKTGRLTTTFNGTPQDPGTPDAPLNEFVLNFSGGAQAALVTPPTCGVYTSNAVFTPWSSPFVENAFSESKFAITSGPGGSGSCTGPLPFTPTLTAGSTTDQAGGFTDFSMLLQRADGQQRVSKLQFKTPEGLLGMISNVPLCPEPQASKGECSSASQIGHTIVGAGPGPYPLFIPQAGQPPAPIYLTGGYEGAPYGLSIVVPIVAGPFTLQTQIVRGKIEVDPHTAQLTITTDPVPTIIDGIPADLRSINAVIDRPRFMFNPTDCNPAAFSGTATSTEGATTAISSPFQVGSCQSLTFKPDFTVSTAAHSSKADGASLDVKLVYPTTPLGANQASSQSNIGSVKVDLPKQLPSELKTLQKACTAAVFEANPAACPAASIVGHATVVTPVLPVPLTGPAYFVSHGGEAFPSLIVVLQGYGVTVDLVGTTFINGKTDITSSTFKQVPDVPIHSFELVLPQGPFSALAANLPKTAKGSFCGQKLAMPTLFTAQNGAVIKQSTPIAVTGCAKAKPKKKAVKKKHGKKTKKKG
jgi:hypothetical protein